MLVQLQQDYPEDLRLIFRHFPLSYHDKAAPAAQAVEAAGLQNEDAFFEMKDFIFKNQGNWSAMTAEQFIEWIISEADRFGLDQAQFAEDINSDAIQQKVQKALQEATALGVPHTPFLLINDVPSSYYQAGNDYNSLQNALLQAKTLKERQFAACPEMIIDPEKEYTATLHTNKGDIVVELYAKQAPFTVNSFVSLAQNGWYNNVPFHRVIPDFVAQSGDPSGTGTGNPGYFYGNEIDPDLNFDAAGIIGMAPSGSQNNGSQFFITYAPLPDLDGRYTIFGKVIEGIENVEMLTPRSPDEDQIMPEPDMITEITIEEN